ncbi:MAG: Ig-like domain-containing protein [Ruminococcus sp.]|nr:Ig-like domain-containing protein [Ruminococcus sp.]
MKKYISLLLIVLMCMTAMAGCEVFVPRIEELELEEITLSEEEISMTVGETQKLVVEFEPSDMSEKIHWTTNDKEVATVSGGLVTAISEGSATIIAESESGASAFCVVTVSEIQVLGVSLNKTQVTLKVGSTVQVVPTVTPAGASDDSLQWSSSDTSVATVSDNGYITGVKDGQVQITCSYSDSIFATCEVTVKSGLDNPEDAPGFVPSPSYNSGTTGGYENVAGSAYYSDCIFPSSHMTKLTYDGAKARLDSMTGYSPSGSFVQDAINEIYAKQGYIFNDETLNLYYQSKAWYVADSSFAYSDFSETEIYNITLLEGME